MKLTNSGFTLVESLITLLIVSLCLVIGAQPPKTVGKNTDQWLATFKTRWQNARLTAQSRGRSSVLPTGYVAPITITLNGSPNIKIIFSLGGGEFRVSKK